MKVDDQHNKQQGSIRDGFGQGIVEAARENKEVVALCGDLTSSLRLIEFRKQFGDRFIEVGVAEQNMIGVAAGLALGGKIPFAASFAVFNPGRNWEQIRQSVCYSNLNVKIVGGHAGLNVGPDGATHQALEDLALTRVLPNMTVVVPCDQEQARQATVALAKHRGPAYLRLVREESAQITSRQNVFELGRAQILKTGQDVTLVACGLMVELALAAAQDLAKLGYQAEVINMHTIKPLDEETLFASLTKTGCLVTAEEHQLAGGLGSAVLESLAGRMMVPVARVGVLDSFGQSGTASQLFQAYGLTSQRIVKLAEYVISQK